MTVGLKLAAGACLAALGLAGCSAKPATVRSGLPAGASLEASLSSTDKAATTASLSAPLATVPAGTAVPAARLRPFLPKEAGPFERTADGRDGAERRILAKAAPDGSENYVELAVWTREPDAKPTAEAIAAELKREFPRVDMRVVTTPRYNAYGQYGLAIGRTAAGERCAYGWQWIDADGLAKAKSDGAAASVRLRACRSDLTVDQLAVFMERLDLRRDDARAAAAAPRRRKARVARPRQADERPAAVAERPAAAVRPPAVSPPPAAMSAPAASVPAGPATIGGRRYLAGPTEAPAASAPGPRPVGAPPAPVGAPSDPARPGRPADFGSGLPAEALVGPGAASRSPR